MAHCPRLVVVGAVNGKRIRGLQKAAERFSDIVDLHVCNYRDVLQNPQHLADALQHGCWLKIDSPAEDAQVQADLILQGRQRHPQNAHRTSPHAMALGELMASDDWYAGLSEALQNIERCIPAGMQINWLNSVDSILLMMDKWKCQQHFIQSHICAPKLLGQIRSYNEFKLLMQEHQDITQCFVKSRYGSSACGVIAYRHNRRGRQQALSTSAFENGRLIHRKRIHAYTQAYDISSLIDVIAQYGAYVEAWIAKPALYEHCTYKKSFDIRVVALAGKAQHQIARASQSPITNLHLDSERVDVAKALPAQDIQCMHQAIAQAAGIINGARIIGFDAICTRSGTAFIEANAFGDYLPALLHGGQDTYSAQLMYILNQSRSENTRHLQEFSHV